MRRPPRTQNLLLTFEDALAGKKMIREFELVVLATGIVPQTKDLPKGLLGMDEFGFVLADNGVGIHSAGCAKRPAEVASSVRDATGAALKALQIAVRTTEHG